MKFGSLEPFKIMFDFLRQEAFLAQFVRAAPYQILVFLTNFNFFRRKEIILLGKKCTALFQTHWEKVKFYHRASMGICSVICKYVMPHSTPGTNRVN